MARPFSLSYDELAQLAQVEAVAVIDCTGGWYSAQRWRGVPLGALLDEAGDAATAASVTIEAVSGYKRRFPVDEARRCLLALGTLEGETGETFHPLSHGHGFPARLVAAERRGMEWVKWVAVIRVNETGPLAQAPLPLQ